MYRTYWKTDRGDVIYDTSAFIELRTLHSRTAWACYRGSQLGALQMGTLQLVALQLGILQLVHIWELDSVALGIWMMELLGYPGICRDI